MYNLANEIIQIDARSEPDTYKTLFLLSIESNNSIATYEFLIRLIQLTVFNYTSINVKYLINSLTLITHFRVS